MDGPKANFAGSRSSSRLGGSPLPARLRAAIILATMIAAGAFPSLATSITLTNDDALGQTSFAAKGWWNDSVAPTGTKDYFTSTYSLRTAVGTGAQTFQGKSLTLDGGTLIFKTAGLITVTNLTLNGGGLAQAGTGGTPDTAQLKGVPSINLKTDSFINHQGSGRTLDIQSVVTNTGALTIYGSGGGGGLVQFSAAMSYSGITTISNTGTLKLNGGANTIKAGNSVAVNGTLDLNGNDQTFDSVTGSGSVTIGGGVLTIGSGGSSPTFDGVIGGTGGLTKLGVGTLTLTGANTYSGATAIGSGTFLLSGTGSISNSASISIAAASTFDVSARSSPYNLGASTTLTASGTGTAVGGTAAAIKGPPAGIVSLGSQPIILACDGAHPALFISQGTLSLNSNVFTVNKTTPLSLGTYTLIQQATGNIATSGTFTVTGTAIGAGNAGRISVSGSSVVLMIEVAGSASASWSTVEASPASVTADGAAPTTVTVTLRDVNGTAVSGRTVTLASSRVGMDTISTASGPSSSSGVVAFTVTSTTVGSSVFTATDTTDSVTITGTATVIFMPDQYETLRLKWANFLIGSTNASALAGYATTANGYWSTLDTSPSRTYLWSDFPFGTTDQAIWTSYSRLQAMATAWSAPGCSLYGNTSLRDDIVSALDWMNANVYTPTSTRTYGDWYGWEIRAPENMNNTATLMYPALSGSQITNYCKSVDQFNPDSAQATYGWMTGNNRANQCLTMMIRGILGRNSAKMNLAQTNLSPVFVYVTDDDGFYRDGSFIQHHDIAYNGAYGDGCLGNVASLVNLLAGSTWAITDTNLVNVYAWVSNSFEPLIYGGAMMDMVRGRTIAFSSYQADKDEGADTLGYILQVAQFAPPAIATSFSNFANAQYPRLPSGQFHFAGMDRVVALRAGFGIGLSMSSSRIANYESINGNNLHGWFTGDGMTYLYLGIVDRQFAGDFWCTVDPYHLPGTTVDQTARTDAAGQGATTGENWVGGPHLAGTYGAVGMSLNANASSLVAKKSWFMFDQELACLGAGITCSGVNEVHTTAENRRLGISPANTLTVNGTVYPPIIGWTSNLTGVSWCALNGVGGYYFPGGANLLARFKACLGAWNDINSGSSTSVNTDDYLQLIFNHGVGPSAAKYAYVVLPNLSAISVSNYAANAEIVVLQNSTTCQAVSKPSAGLVAANFWVDGTNTAGLITVNKKASVIASTNAAGIAVGIADPTQANAGAIAVTLDWTAKHVMLQAADAGVTVVQLMPTIILSVNVNGAKGKTFNASFASTNVAAVNTPPNAVATNCSTSVGAAVEVELRSVASDAETPASRLMFTVNHPTNGTVTLLPNGHTARFTPATNFAGVANFQFSVTDAWPDSRLAAAYDFEPPEDLADSTVMDVSGQGADGQITKVGSGAATLTDDVPPSLVPWDTQSVSLREAGNLNGARVLAPTAASSVLFNLQSWTLAGWFQRSTSTNDDFIFYLGNSQGFGATNELQLYGVSGQNNLALRHYVTNSATTDLDLTVSNILTSVWHHAAVTFENTNGSSGIVKLYVDGTLAGTDSAVTFNLPLGSTPIFGGHASSTANVTRWFNGRLDDLAVFNDALPASDIARLASVPIAYFGGETVTNTVWLSVTPTNTAPALATIPNRSLLAGTTLTLTNIAADSNLPPQRLCFSLAAAPAGATINASNGIVSWRPSIAQVGTSNQFAVVVTQAGWLTNLAPVADVYVRDGGYSNLNYGGDTALAVKLSGTPGFTRETFLRFNLSGLVGDISDASLRLIPLSTSLAGTHAAALATNDAWGETTITWMNKPGADSPVVTWLPLTGVPALVPVTTLAQSQLDTDRSCSLRVYALETTSDGLVTYGSRKSGVNSPTLMLTMTNGSLLSATQSFWVTVTAPAQPKLSAPRLAEGKFQMLVGGDSGPDYAVEASTNLVTWTSLIISNSPALPFLWSEVDTNTLPQRFYRVRLGP